MTSLPPHSSQPSSAWPIDAPSTQPPDFPRAIEAPTQTSGLAVASLVLGIAGVVTCGLGSVIGLILGIVSLGSTIGNPPQRRGKGIAIAGIIVSALTFFIGGLIMLTALMLPAVAKARSVAQQAASTLQMKNVAQAHQMYAAANNDYMAPPGDWAGAISPYAAGSVNPNAILLGGMAAERSVAMNAGLAGKRLSDLQAPFKTVLLFETMAGNPPSGGLDLVPSNPYNRQGYLVAFADGNVRLVPEHEIEVLIWDP